MASRLQPETWIALVATLVYAPMLSAGYGADTDTYLVLSAGADFVSTGLYRPSRPPGYFAFELVTYCLDQLGGSLLTNAATLGMTLTFLCALGRVSRHLNVPRVPFVVAFAALCPYLVVSAAVTMEYLWALGLVFAGFACALANRRWSAAMLLGAAVALRLPSLLMVACVYGFVAHEPATRRSWLRPLCLTLLLVAAAYWPPFSSAGYSLKFAHALVGGPELWSLTARLGRFVYKNVYFWGLQGSLALLVFVVRGFRCGAFSGLPKEVLLLCAAAIGSTELLYLAYPLEPAYLLPLVPFVGILLSVCMTRASHRVILFVSLASSQLLCINLAKPDVPAQARSGRVGLWLEPGTLLNDLSQRAIYMGCRDAQCWAQRSSENPARQRP